LKKLIFFLILMLSVITQANAASILISWHIPEEKNILGYEIYYQEKILLVTGREKTTIKVPMKNIVVNNIEGSEIGFSMSAYNKSGKGLPSGKAFIYVPGVETDTDNDGFTDREEIDIGTDPYVAEIIKVMTPPVIVIVPDTSSIKIEINKPK